MARPAPNICSSPNTPERVSAGIPSFAFAANIYPSSLNPSERITRLLDVVVPEDKMAWIRLYQEVFLDKVMAPVLRCPQLGLFGALAVAIFPIVLKVLQPRSCQ